jgi:hydroxyacylglutathione hydrolase
MISVKSFTFNPFQENTYVLSDETGHCLIIDPGCYEPSEKNILFDYIVQNKLKPIRLINTHGHIDHILGNAFVHAAYALEPEIHHKDLHLLQAAPEYGANWGIMMEPSPEPCRFIDEDETIKFGHSSLQVLYTPGHSPGSICLLSKDDGFVIGGDVLFKQSIGRTDLPGGDYSVLLNSIRQKLFTLDNKTIVYSGHGPETTIGFEKRNNPFLQ